MNIYSVRKYIITIIVMFIVSVSIHSLIVFCVKLDIYHHKSISSKNERIDIILQSIQKETSQEKIQSVEEQKEDNTPAHIKNVVSEKKIDNSTKNTKQKQKVKAPLKVIQQVSYSKQSSEEIQPVEIEPSILTPVVNRKPLYPDLARKRGQQGRVLLRAYIDENGTLIDLIIEKSSGYSILDSSALRSVRYWSFAPSTYGGIAKKGSILIPISFVLKK